MGTQLRIRCCQTNRRERGMHCGEKLLESGAQVRANVKPHFRLITVGDYYSCGLEPNQAVAHFKRRCASNRELKFDSEAPRAGASGAGSAL